MAIPVACAAGGISVEVLNCFAARRVGYTSQFEDLGFSLEASPLAFYVGSAAKKVPRAQESRQLRRLQFPGSLV